MRIAILIPTYNEVGNIGPLLDEVLRQLKKALHHDWHILVIDAASPDGTGAVVQSRNGDAFPVHLIVEEKKRGIGHAYIIGIQYAYDVLRADVYVQFDGDGQHDPADITRLIQKIEAGYDMCIGSRYIEGGSVPRDWAPHRKILSFFGSLYARLLLELPVHDVTSGLRATRCKGPAERLPRTPEAMISHQYAYNFQFLYDMLRAGGKVCEIPIHFRMREHDVSKNTLRGILESLRVTGLLRLRTIHEWRLLRVVGVGGIGFVVQSIIFHVLGIELELLRPSTALVLGGEAAILSNFFLNERFTFADKRASAAPILHRLGRFHLVAAGSVALQWLFVRGAESLIGFNPTALWLAYLCGLVLGLLTNYLGYFFWVWRARW